MEQVNKDYRFSFDNALQLMKIQNLVSKKIVFHKTQL